MAEQPTITGHGQSWATAYSRESDGPLVVERVPRCADHELGSAEPVSNSSSDGTRESAQRPHRCRWMWPDSTRALRHGAGLFWGGMGRGAIFFFPNLKNPPSFRGSSRWLRAAGDHAWGSCSAAAERDACDCGLLAFIDFGMIGTVPTDCPCPPFRTSIRRPSAASGQASAGHR